MGRRFTCEMEPPRMKDGFSEATVVLDDGMRGGGGLVGRVVGSRTASGRLVITWCGAGCRTFKGKKKWFKIVNFTVRNTLLISAIPEFSHVHTTVSARWGWGWTFLFQISLSLELNPYTYSGHTWSLWGRSTQLPVKPELPSWCSRQTMSA